MVYLSKILTKNNVLCYISCRFNFHFMARYWRPDIIIHTIPAMLASAVRKGYVDDSVRVIIIPQEGSERAPETIRAFYRGLEDDSVIKRVSVVYLWNKYQLEWMRENLPGVAEKSVLLGNPRLEIPEVLNRRPRRGDEFTVGFVGRFPSFANHRSRDSVADLWADRSEQNHEERCNVYRSTSNQVNALVFYADLMHTLLKDKRYRVSYRPHHEEHVSSPGLTNMRRRYRSRFSADNSYSVATWALGCNVIVSTSSASFAEFYICGVPFICIDNVESISISLNSDEYASVAAVGDEDKPRDFNSVLERIRAYSEGLASPRLNGKFEALLMEEYSFPFKGSIVQDICSFAQDKPRERSKIGVPLFFGDVFYLFRLLHSGSLTHSLNKNYFRALHRVTELNI